MKRRNPDTTAAPPEVPRCASTARASTPAAQGQYPSALFAVCEATETRRTSSSTQAVSSGRSGGGLGAAAPTSLDTLRGSSPNDLETQAVTAVRRDCGGPCESVAWARRNPARVPWVRRARWRVCRVDGAPSGARCSRGRARGVRCAEGRNRAAVSRWSSLTVRCETAGLEVLELERCVRWGRNTRRRARRAHPFPAAVHRPKHKGWCAYVNAVVEELEHLGQSHVAARLRKCGALARVRPCGGCGEQCGHATVPVGCDVRACPLCSRRDAKESVRDITAAAVRTPELARQGLTAKRVELLETHAAAVARLADLAPGVPSTLGPKRRAASVARAQKIARCARRDLHALRDLERGSWGWRLITISPPRDVSSSSEATPRGLRERVCSVWRRWRRIWREASVSGLAASWARVELSSTGHVHIHALYFGPYLPQSWLAATAGCIVDVRGLRDVPGVAPDAALESMVREAAKYALKSASPGRRGWIAGEAAGVAHPRLAAAWTVATRNLRLRESYGLAHEAAKAAEACDPPETPGIVCWRCGADLAGVEPVFLPTRLLAARVSSDAWRLAVHFERPKPCDG